MIVVIEHEPVETACRLGAVLRDHGHRLHVVRPHLGEPLPADLDGVDGLVVMGGPQNVDQAGELTYLSDEMDYLTRCHEASLPVVGVCLGAQLIAAALGGEVGPAETPEWGFGKVKQTFFGTTDPLHSGLPWDTPVFHAHGQTITQPPPGGTPMPLSGSEHSKCQAFRVGLTTYGFQYHFEWTRGDIQEIVAEQADWVRSIGGDPDATLGQMDEAYPMYRHFGDRLCLNLVTLLYPLDKRLPPSGVPVENFHGHKS
jgi:GMP synthase-like glutamine amidotransferase